MNSRYGLKHTATKSVEYDMNSNRVLFTGGSGLLALNWGIAIRDRFKVILGLHRKSIALGTFELNQIDIESVESLISNLKAIQPDIVIHTAGLTSVERCEKNPEFAFHVNAKIAEVVAMACSHQGVPLVHISTDHIFNGDEALLPEAQTIQPLNIYGETKALAEKLVLTAYPEALVIRTNFFGWGTSYRKSFSDIIIEGLSTGKQLILFDDVYYTPILVEDLAIAVHDLIDLQVRGVINVVGDERISKYEFGMKLAKKFGLDCNFIKRGLIADAVGLVRRPNDMSLSNQKACEILGRKLGGINEYLSKLLLQEKSGVFQEIRNL